MSSADQSLETLRDIRSMMERSSRFISLSGWSGIAAGLSALGGAAFAVKAIGEGHLSGSREFNLPELGERLVIIGAVVLFVAVTTAFFFTWLKSRKTKAPLWSTTARRLLWNTMIPLGVGGLVVIRLLQLGYYLMIAPACLLFYGLALVNGSKYTLGEVRYLGYGQIILGIINMWMPHWGLVFWALGFGILHIIYGALMWWKYERVSSAPMEEA